MITIREERMSDAFTKWHIGGMPCAAVLHQFTKPDDGDAHSHPWNFRSVILYGGYVEEVFQLDGSRELVRREPGDSFLIDARHIHRIVELPLGECWTIILPQGPAEQTSGFYQFRDDGTYHRFWHDAEFKKVGG